MHHRVTFISQLFFVLLDKAVSSGTCNSEFCGQGADDTNVLLQSGVAQWSNLASDSFAKDPGSWLSFQKAPGMPPTQWPHGPPPPGKTIERPNIDDAAAVGTNFLPCMVLCFIIGLALTPLFWYSSRVGCCCALLYLALSTAVDICISMAKEHGVQYDPTFIVILVEFGKLVVSLILFFADRLRQKFCFGSPLMQAEGGEAEFLWMSGPALCYAAKNILVFIAINRNDITTFGVFRETMILWTALIWAQVFNISLGWKRMLSICLIAVGLALNQLLPLLDATFSCAVFLVCLMALTNACGSVGNEFVLKKNYATDINLQNAMVYFWCLAFCVVSLCITDMEGTKLASFLAFCHGMDSQLVVIAVLLLLSGLLVSRILKYADSLQKAVVASLRGPALIATAYFVGLPYQGEWMTFFSAVLVAASACVFLLQGKPEPKQREEELLKHLKTSKA